MLALSPVTSRLEQSRLRLRLCASAVPIPQGSQDEDACSSLSGTRGMPGKVRRTWRKKLTRPPQRGHQRRKRCERIELVDQLPDPLHAARPDGRLCLLAEFFHHGLVVERTFRIAERHAHFGAMPRSVGKLDLDDSRPAARETRVEVLAAGNCGLADQRDNVGVAKALARKLLIGELSVRER